MGKYTAKLTFLWYDILVKKGLCIGLAAIPKTHNNFLIMFFSTSKIMYYDEPTNS